MKRGKIPFIATSLVLLTSLSSCGNKAITYVSKEFSYASGSTTDYVNKAYYSDDYFDEPSTTYNASLATASLCMAMSSFASNINSTNSDYSYRYKNADAFFKEFGFGSLVANADYQKQPGTDTVGVVYANKKIGDDTLVAIGIRGANYQQEWASNVTLGHYADNPYHEGFYNAATELLNGLNEYLVNQSVTGSIKIWISGYSRAGATANIASGLLDKSIVDNTKILGNSVSFSKEDIYSYCFEPPQGVYFDSNLDTVDAHGENYNNIFNIVNGNDPVPMVAMTSYDFTRFGIDCYLSNPITDPDYSSNIAKIKRAYNAIDNYAELGEQYYVDQFAYKSLSIGGEKAISLSKDTDHINWTQGLFLKELVTTLGDSIGDRETYVNNVQTGLRSIFSLVFKNGGPKGSFVDLGINFVKQVLSGNDADVLMDDLIHQSTYFVKDLVPVISRTLVASGIADIDVKELLNNLEHLLLAIAKLFLSNPSLIVSLISSTNVKALGSAHYPELCLANMEARDPNYSSIPVTSGMSGRYYLFKSPDITSSFIIKKDGNAVAEMTLGEVKDVNSDNVYGLDKENFVAYLPVDSGYTIEMSNGSTGSLSVYEPTTLKYVTISDITSSSVSSQLDDNVKLIIK